MNEKNNIPEGKELVNIAVCKAQEKKAENIVILNPGEKSYIAEWIIICQGDNEIQNMAIADSIIYELKSRGSPPWNKEGLENGRWILLDFSDVIVNILLPEIREFYQLEALWKDYPRINI